MAVKGKGKQIAFPSSSGKRKKPGTEAAERRKRKRSGVLQFFDDAAVDADYDDEEVEDPEIEGKDHDLDFTDEDKVGSKDVKGAGKSHQLPFFLKEEELSGDELKELIKERYGKGSEYVVYDEDHKECDDGVPVVDSMKDATIWRVKCMAGRELQIAFCLMQKYVDLQNFGTKLEISSAFALEHVKGYVYIEADKACDVTEACKGFFNLYSTRMGLVPRNEVPHLLSVQNKACEVSKGMWVRLKSGKYKGDIGKVVVVDDARKRATVKLVPRIDLQAISKKFGGGVSLKQATVPSPRLISSHELEHFRPHVEIRRDSQTGEVFEVLDGLMLKDGYLYKKVSIGSLVYWGIQPSKDELLKFMDTSQDEFEDVSWLPSVYDGQKKMKSSKASDKNMKSSKASDKNMKSSKASDNKEPAKKVNGFDLHDLVLFGRKAFGVIIAIESDSFQILKGDIEGQEVVTVKIQEIKNGCVDKMFTASDRHMKTISINDIVKVLDGPLEGRQGIVRHMFKGTLFIYDDIQLENSGIFCVKSELCENIKKSKDSSFENSGNKSAPSFAQSPIRSCEQEDSSHPFSRHRRSETDQTFSIGQTLRIRKGPLKGYLCRVVGVYRSDITVKLDSLVKVITVEDKFLSVPNLKRDDSAMLGADLFGTQDRQPIGGPSDEGREPIGTSSWDVGRDSWQALSTSRFSFGSNNDRKADQEVGADPWCNKVASGSEDQEQEPDPWGSKVASGATDKEQGADPWSNKVASVAKDQGQGTDPWGSKVASGTTDQGQGADPWCSKVDSGAIDQGQGADPWVSKLASGTRDQEQGADPWGSKVAFPGARDQEQGVELWGSKAAFGGSCHSDKALDKLAMSSGASGGKNSAWNNTSGGERATAIKDQAGNWEQGDGWNKNSVRTITGTDGWDKAKLPRVDAGENWGMKSLKSGNQVDPSDSVLGHWDGPKADDCGDTLKNTGVSSGWDRAANHNNASKGVNWELSSNWARPEVTSNEKADAWDVKGKAVIRSEVTWGKASVSQEKDANESRLGGKSFDSSSHRTTINIASTGDQATGWDAAAMRCNKSAVEHGDQSSSWDKVKVPSDGQSDKWDKAKTSATETGGWSKTGFSSQSQTDGWNKSKSFGGDQVSSWNKVDNEKADKNDQRDNSRNFEGGRGFGRGRGRGRNAWDSGNGDGDGKWNKSMDLDESQGSGCRRGQYGGRGTRDEDNMDRPGDSGGWGGAGRGRGRGRNGDAGRFSDNFDDTRSSGRGCGQGRGGGRFHSSDWKNNQEDLGDGSFSRNPGSSWGNDQNKSFLKKDEGSDKWNTPKAPGENQPSRWNQETSGNDAASGGDKWNMSTPSAGNESAAGAGGNWDRAKPFGAKQSSGWNSGSAASEEAGKWDAVKTPDVKKSSCWAGDDGKDWNTPKPCVDQTSGRGRGEEAGGASLNWEGAKSSGPKQSSDWNNSERKDWRPKSSELSFSDWNRAPAGNETGDASAGGDHSNKAKPRSGGYADEGSNWNDSKAWGVNKSSDWNKNSIASEAGSEGNWARQKTYSGGNQSSGWKNDDVNSWTKPKSFGGHQSSSCNDGRGGDQSESWNHGRNSGSDQPVGGGRGNSFSNRGRGRGGRNFNGRHSSGWNGGADANKEGNGSGDQTENFSRPRTFGRGQSSGWNQEGGSWSKGKEPCGDQSAGILGSWNSGGTASDKGPWDSCKSEAGKPPSGWNKSSSVASDGGARGGTGNWDRPKGFDSSGGPSFNSGSASDKEFNTGKAEGWNQKKVVDGADSSVSAKEDGKGKGQSGEAWGSKGENHTSGWNAGSVSAKDSTTGTREGWNQKKASGGAGGSSGWNSSAASAKEVCDKNEHKECPAWGQGSSKKGEASLSSWNPKGSVGAVGGWNSSSAASTKEIGGGSRNEGCDRGTSQSGAAVKEADAGGDQGSGWERAPGSSWGNAKEGTGGKGGW